MMRMMMDMQTDLLAGNVRTAWKLHAAAIETKNDREILVAYIAVLQAEQALYADCTGAADQEHAQDLGYQIEDAQRDLAKMGPA